MATVEAGVQGARPTRRSRGGAFAILFAPVSLLIVLFLVPMLLMFQVSTLVDPFDPDSGSTLQHFANVLTDPLNRKIAVTTFLIASTAMVLMLAIAIRSRRSWSSARAGGSCRSCWRWWWRTS
jgi:spermidine/putrescine transport system permease protein